MVVFVGFDDTLCLHSRSVASKDFTHGGNPYVDSKLNSILVDVLQRYKTKGRRIVVLTAASSFMLEHKVKYFQEQCPGLIDEFVSVSIDCSKAEYIQQFIEAEESIVFIDDSGKDRAEVEKLKGVAVYSPQEIMLIETSLIR